MSNVHFYVKPTLSDEPCAGQVWQWCVPGEWDELFLLLDNPHPNVDVFEALNLLTGHVEAVTPCLSAGDWDLIG